MLEGVLEELTAKYITGEIDRPLSPQVLEELGGNFRGLYHAGFHRVSRPRWAEERYPGGFEDLVAELNDRLAARGIQIQNGKLEIGLYGKLSGSELATIKVFQSLHEQGEISRAEAIDTLRQQYNIVLSASRQNYFFSAQAQVPDEDPVQSALNERKAKLASRVEDLKKELGVDLSIKQCVQGLVFEAFVGCYLSFRYGAENVSAQKELPIAYRDLNGSPHRRVYLDFAVNADGHEAVYEVKLGNSFDGILNSALPQLAAFEAYTRAKERVNVVYLNPSPLMKFAVDLGIRAGDELNAMGLDALALSARRINEMVNYVSFRDLLLDDPLAEPFHGQLSKIEKFIARADTAVLRQYEDALRRISGAPSERIPALLAQLCDWADEVKPITPKESQAAFGKHSERIDGGESGSAARIRSIQRSLVSAQTRLLTEVYERLYGEAPAALRDGEIERLEKADRSAFDDAVLDVLSAREQRQLERLERNHAMVRDDGAQVVSAYQRISQREQQETLENLGNFKAECLAKFTTLDQAFGAVPKSGKVGKARAVVIGQAYQHMLTECERKRAETPEESPRRLAANFAQFHEAQRSYAQATMSAFIDLRVLLERYSQSLEPVTALEQHERAAEIRALCERRSKQIADGLKRVRGEPYLAQFYKQREKDKKGPHAPLMKAYSAELNEFLKEGEVSIATFECLCDYAARLMEEFNISVYELFPMSIKLATLTKEIDAGALLEWTYILEASMGRLRYTNQSGGSALRGALAGEEPRELLASRLKHYEGIWLVTPQMPDTPGTRLMDAMDHHLGQIEKLFAASRDSGSPVDIDVVLTIARDCYSYNFAHLGNLGFEWLKQPARAKRKPPPSVEVPKITPERIAAFGDETFARLDAAHFWTCELIADFYMRKAQQAKVISYFSPELASDFLMSNELGRIDYDGDMQAVRDRIVKLTRANDEIFSQLVLGKAETGPPMRTAA